jgi:phosphotriesterase-related protein
MSEIMTVCGPIPTGSLGFTSMHEHTLINGRVFRKRHNTIVGHQTEDTTFKNGFVRIENLTDHRHNITLTKDNLVIEDEELIIDELNAFKASGGVAVLDTSAIGIRSDLQGIKRISQKSDVHIIVSTGFYAEDAWPKEFASFSTQQFATIMHREVAAGIDGTGIFPGHIKVAIENEGVSKQEEKVLRAAVRVSNETGLSMTIHHGLMLPQEGGLRILNIIKKEGAQPDRMLLCHLQIYFFPHDLKTLILKSDSWRLNLDYAKKILDQGMNICIDCFGHQWDLEMVGFVMTADYHRLAGLTALIDAGYADQLVIGTDSFVKINACRYGGEGYRRLTHFVVPTLLELGVSKENVNRIVIDNPARLLTKAN